MFELAKLLTGQTMVLWNCGGDISGAKPDDDAAVSPPIPDALSPVDQRGKDTPRYDAKVGDTSDASGFTDTNETCAFDAEPSPDAQADMDAEADGLDGACTIYETCGADADLADFALDGDQFIADADQYLADADIDADIEAEADAAKPPLPDIVLPPPPDVGEPPSSDVIQPPPEVTTEETAETEEDAAADSADAAADETGTIQCTPTIETCNNFDDDCDGTIDNNLTDALFGMSCEDGLGICKSAGFYICDDGEIVCNAKAGDPLPKEYCNNLDDDCDGNTDEPFIEKLGKECKIGKGICESAGTYICSNDEETAACNAAIIPSAEEICDGLDNNCDGTTDENYNPPPAPSCGIGECESAGEVSCTGGGEGYKCSPGASTEEVCDEMDNDCDGATDENGISNDPKNKYVTIESLTMSLADFKGALLLGPAGKELDISLQILTGEAPVEAIKLCYHKLLPGACSENEPLASGCSDKLTCEAVVTPSDPKQAKWNLWDPNATNPLGIFTAANYDNAAESSFGIRLFVFNSDGSKKCFHPYDTISCK